MPSYFFRKKSAWLLGLTWVFLSSSSFAAAPVEKVSLLLNWKFQYEFAGFIMAKEKGFYRDAGLDVELHEYEENTDIIDSVLSQQYNYGLYNSSISIKDGKVEPTVLMATYFQQSPLILVTSKKIKHPKDLTGKTVMLSNNEAKYSSLALLLDHFYLNDKNTTFVPHSFNTDAFISGKVDAMSVFKSNEIHDLDKKSIEYNIIDPSNYGFSMSAVNLLTSITEASKHPERTKKFIHASNKGWAYALAHTDETIRLIRQHYAKHKSIEALEFEAEITKEMMLLSFFRIGEVNTELSQRMLKQLKFSGLVDTNQTLKNTLFTDVLNSFSKNTMLTPQQIEYLNHKKSITMCVDPDWMPFEKISEGKHIGIANDVINHFNKQLPIPIKLVPTNSWQESISLAKSRQCDIFSLATETPDRLTYMDFTQPYMEVPVVIATKMDTLFINNIKDIKHKKLGIVKGYAIAEQLKREIPGINIVEVASIQEGLSRVESGELFGHIDNLMVIANLIQHDFTGVLKVSARLPDTLKLSIATRNDQPQLKQIFDTLISNISDAELQKIYNKWVAVKQEQAFDYSLLKNFTVIILLLALAYLLHYLRLSKLNKLLLIQSTTDKLTCLYNRAKADSILAQKKTDVDRYDTDLSIILLDIDYFKQINDTHGHIAGDKVLFELAQVLKHNVRVNDSVCRWGGEEFLIICPNIGLDGANELAQKLLQKIRNHEFSHLERITASAGISQFSKQLSSQTTLQNVDTALYHAKDSGRDQAITYESITS